MRAPRDLDSYIPAEAAAAWLRGLAAQVERGAKAHPLVKINVDIRHWNPAWTKKR